MTKQTFEDVNIEITFRENAGDMNSAEMLRAYATLLAEKENNGITHWNGTTHYAGCVGAGPKHYECALQEIGRLRGTIMDLRAKLEASKQETEIQKAKADKHYELGTEYFDLYTKAVKGQLKEKNGG